MHANPPRLLQNLLLIITPVTGWLFAIVMINAGWSFEAATTAAVTLVCAVWWISEALPIPVTSLLPLALFPLLGVLTPTQVAEAYGNPLIILLMGGFLLSTAMESSGAHRRIALMMVNLFGGNSHRRVVFGFMAASALLSMWISNTATTLMLLPIALAVLQNCEDKRLTVPLLLGICYAASVGGTGTPIGTPPNLIFMRVYGENTGVEITFSQWMMWAIPMILVFLPIVGFWLTRNLHGREIISIPTDGTWTPAQKRVLAIFALTAFFWITRNEPFGGWSDLFNLPNANDAAVALCAVILMCAIPNGEGGRLLDWETANRIPWGVLLLFAGGIAIAKAFNASGLAEGMASNLTALTALPVILMIGLVCLAVTFMTEVTSNTATASLLMPVLAVAGAATGIDPLLLMVPAAISCSYAFMLPPATAPNAIIFGTNLIPIRIMALNGLALNLLGAMVITIICYLNFS